MHQNYYLLKKISAALEPRLLGKELIECFSLKNQEIVLAFAGDKEEFFVKAMLAPAFASLMFPETQSKPKKYFVNLFKEAILKKVIGVHQFLNERSLEIQLEDSYSIVFQFFGRRSNVLLCENRKILASYKNATLGEQVKGDRPIEQTKAEFIELGGEVKALFPTFGKKCLRELDKDGFSTLTLDEKWEKVQGLLSALEDDQYYLTYNDNVPVLLLFPPDEQAEVFHDPLKAITTFSFQYLKQKAENDLRIKVSRSIHQQMSKLESYVQKAGSKLQELQSGLGYREMADIVMANLYQIDEKQDKATLFNFYTNEDVTIKLKAGLSPQKNAENFYRKAKNQSIELQKLQKNKDQKEEAYLKLSAQLEEIASLNFYELKDWAKQHGYFKEQQKKEEVKPFKTFEIDGYTVYVGKNAANNDLLTLKYAQKDDLWLHAKDVSGSHTVIKVKSGQKVPDMTIEKVASLAAYYSKRKTESLCPVIVTPKKYVRKRKGAPAGQVVVEREDVVLVPPGLPN